MSSRCFQKLPIESVSIHRKCIYPSITCYSLRFAISFSESRMFYLEWLQKKCQTFVLFNVLSVALLLPSRSTWPNYEKARSHKLWSGHNNFRTNIKPNHNLTQGTISDKKKPFSDKKKLFYRIKNLKIIWKKPSTKSQQSLHYFTPVAFDVLSCLWMVWNVNPFSIWIEIIVGLGLRIIFLGADINLEKKNVYSK